MINTHKLDSAISDCLAEIGETGAGYVVLVHAGDTLAVGTNIDNPDKVAAMLEAAHGIVTKSSDIGTCKGTA